MRKLIFLIMICVYACACAEDEVSAAAEPVAEKPVSPLGHFTWGVDALSAIDLTANNMTFAGIEAMFGYKGRYVRMAGVGAGINMMMSNSSVSYPVYAVLQTNFRPEPTLCFLNLKLGMSINRIYEYDRQSGGYANVGIGFNLARGKTFRSHIIVGYTLITRENFELDGGIYKCPSLHMASFGIGILF